MTEPKRTKRGEKRYELGEPVEVREGVYFSLFAETGPPAPAELIEVVRCKDCRWGKEKFGNIECNVDMNAPSEYHGYEWFCPNGERRRG